MPLKVRSAATAGFILLLFTQVVVAAPLEPVSLREARIVVPSDQPRYVHRAVEDLWAVLDPPARVDANAATAPVIRLQLDPRIAGGSEAFLLEVTRPHREGVTVTIAGAASAGLKFGLFELIALLEVTSADVTIAFPLRIERRPLTSFRGMYAHLHWSYRHPYALRSWGVADWKRYVDLLAHFGFNAIQIWPMMELLPHPLSPEDAAYLARFAEITSYAQAERGMQVLIGSCPNSITEDARGVPIERREYWEFEKRLDPGDPAGLRRILDARSDLYRTIPGADGYWVIDSDPGGWRGSEPYDFVSILAGHRELIDRYCSRPREQPLIYWMWYGWGPGSREENWRVTLAEMRRRLPEPWGLHVCLPDHLRVCGELGLLDRATYFPYNLVETEPAAPLTELRLSAVANAVRTAREADIDGIQGNAQTPLVQLPNIARLADAAWTDSRGLDDRASLDRLARRLAPGARELLNSGWQELGRGDAVRCLELSADLFDASRADRLPGSLAPIVGDWGPRVLEDLARLLEIHARAVRFAEAARASVSARELRPSLTAYLDSLESWLERTGYHDDRIVCYPAYKDPASDALRHAEQRFGSEAVEAELLAPEPGPGVSASTTRRLIVETLRGQRK